MFSSRSMVALMLVLWAGFAFSQQPGYVSIDRDEVAIATVNGIPIPASHFEWLLAKQAERLKLPVTDPNLRSLVREELIRRTLLEDVARRQNIHERVDIRAEIGLSAQNIVKDSFLREYAKSNPITEEMIREEYRIWEQQIGKTEFRLRQILVRSESEARSIIEKLNQGQQFAGLASASEDIASRENGGDVGWKNKMDLDPAILAVVERIPVGGYTAKPVQTDVGWYVIYLESTRPLILPPLWEARDRLVAKLQEKMRDGLIKDLRRKAKVVLNKSY